METILESSVTRNRKRMVKILSLLKEIIAKPIDEGADEQPNKEADEQPDTTEMSDLESEKSVKQKRNKKEFELKILTPDQMFNRLPISLAQLKAGNNSEKITNKITKLLYSLYRSKTLTKTIYNNLNNTI